jgi:hypothetical protein
MQELSRWSWFYHLLEVIFDPVQRIFSEGSGCQFSWISNWPVPITLIHSSLGSSPRILKSQLKNNARKTRDNI